MAVAVVVEMTVSSNNGCSNDSTNYSNGNGGHNSDVDSDVNG